MDTIRYLLKYFYIGTKKYYGSQRQIDLLSVEECIIRALINKDYIENIKESHLEFASRTDRFVSARGAALSSNFKKKPILMEINSELPKEIGLWAYAVVSHDFLSRFNAINRHYKYIVPQTLTYLKKNHSINLEIMKKACKELEGRHDFGNFSKRDKEDRKTIRDMNHVDFQIVNDFIVFDFKSQAFLRQQIRRMVKIIIDLGFGQFEYKDFLELFDASIEVSFQPAQPEGLILWDISFDDAIRFTLDPKSIERMKKYFLSQELKYGLKEHLFRVLQHNNMS